MNGLPIETPTMERSLQVPFAVGSGSHCACGVFRYQRLERRVSESVWLKKRGCIFWFFAPQAQTK